MSPVRFLVAPQKCETYVSHFFIHLCSVKITRPIFAQSESALSELIITQLAGRRYIVLTDERVGEVCIPRLADLLGQNKLIDIVEVESGEACKSAEVCIQLWTHLVELGVTKADVLICVGGGSVCDLGGFIAYTYKRGISCMFVPTTLLAMTDAAVGGKNGIDIMDVKNAVGTFSQPEAIFVFTGFCDSLNRIQFLSGMAEIVKHAVISGGTLISRLQELPVNSSRITVDLLRRSIRVKHAIVSKDPTEKGLRMVLNFGHTIGHAIESASIASGKPIEHGIAVAMGMMVESKLAQRLNLLKGEAYHSIHQIIVRWFQDVMPTFPSWEQIAPYLDQDKKIISKKNVYALPLDLGNVQIRADIDRFLIQESYNQFVA